MDGNLAKLIELLEKDKVIYPLLKHCPYEILRKFRVKEYKENEFVLYQGEVYNTFYILVSGYLDIYAESEQGKKYLFCTYKKGEFVGDMEIFQQAPYICQVEARGNITVLELDRTYFLQWISLDNSFNQYMLRSLGQSSYRMCLEIGHTALYTLKQRICQHLLDIVGGDNKQSVVISTEFLSQKMAVTQRSVNRILKQLKEQELIEVNKGNISIRNYEGLLKEVERK